MENQKEKEIENLCAICGVVAKSQCGSCKNVHYCSSEHQKQHWKVHRATCTSFKTVFDLETGVEHVIASRDLKAGLVILEESAAFYAPHWLQQVGNKHYQLGELCLACGKELRLRIRQKPRRPQSQNKNDETIPFSNGITTELELVNNGSYFCSKCNWPLCGIDCENDKHHSENECKLFRNHEITYPPPQDGEEAIAYIKYTNLISMIRGAGLKSLNPDLFIKIQALQRNSLCPDLEKDLMTFAEGIVIQLKTLIHHIVDRNTRISEVQALTLDNEEDYNSMYRISRLNHFAITSGDQMWGDPKSTMYMYYEACLFSHSCVPNCCWSIGESPDYKIRIRSTVPIKKGERLNLDRGLVATLHYDGTHARQTSLRQRGIFCSCERCVDPSEMGLYNSALTCPRCTEEKNISVENNTGYLLPMNPLSLVPKSLWQCNACSFQLEAKDIFERWKQIYGEMERVCSKTKSEELSGLFADKYNFSDEYATRLEELGVVVGLHRNHFFLFSQIKASVMPSFDMEDIVAVTPELIQRRKRRLLYCLEIEDKISPGLSVHRSHLQSSLITLIYRVLISPVWTDQMSREEIREDYNLFKKASGESLRFFKNEFPSPGENVNLLAERIPVACRALEELKPSWLNKEI